MFFNMLMLFLFGSAVEQEVGSPEFLTLYLFCGVLAGVFSTGLALVSAVPGAILGASEFLVGNNRVPFGLVKNNGETLTNPSMVELMLYKIEPNGNDIYKGKTEAIFTEITGSTPHKHEDGHIHLHTETKGIYIALSLIHI